MFQNSSVQMLPFLPDDSPPIKVQVARSFIAQMRSALEQEGFSIEETRAYNSALFVMHGYLSGEMEYTDPKKQLPSEDFCLGYRKAMDDIANSENETYELEGDPDSSKWC